MQSGTIVLFSMTHRSVDSSKSMFSSGVKGALLMPEVAGVALSSTGVRVVAILGAAEVNWVAHSARLLTGPPAITMFCASESLPKTDP